MNIGLTIEKMISEHRTALGKQKKGEYTCPAHGGCGMPVSNLTYKLDKLGRKSLWGLCKKHGWVAVPLNNKLDIPNVGNTKLKSNKKTRTQSLLF